MGWGIDKCTGNTVCMKEGRGGGVAKLKGERDGGGRERQVYREHRLYEGGEGGCSPG